MFRLIIRDAEGGEAVFPVTKPVTIGRSRECDIRLDDQSISRTHARVFLDYGDPVIEDLDTVNGTLVNGERVRGKKPLKPGDLIQIAGEKIRIIETNPLDDFVATTNLNQERLEREKREGSSKSPWNEPIEPRTPREIPGGGDVPVPEQAGEIEKKPSSKFLPFVLGFAGVVLFLFILFFLVAR